jgi:hypothetical protein
LNLSSDLRSAAIWVGEAPDVEKGTDAANE